MRMIYRLHLSFALLLLCILAVTAVLIYPLLLDTLVDSQRKELRNQASMLMGLSPVMPLMPAQEADTQRDYNMMPVAGITNALLIAPGEKVVYTNLNSEATTELMELSKLDLPGSRSIWQGKDDQYIVETLTATHSIEPDSLGVTAVVATPLSKIKAMQISLFKRLMIILSVGVIVAFLLSMLITKRLVKPLGDLRKELNKVKSRRFSEVQLVETGGEIGEVAKTVYTLAGELETYQRTQKQFFQNTSHELKTPLMSIQGYAEGIKDGIFTGDEANTGLDVIAKECERLKKNRDGNDSSRQAGKRRRHLSHGPCSGKGINFRDIRANQPATRQKRLADRDERI